MLLLEYISNYNVDYILNKYIYFIKSTILFICVLKI